MTDNDQISQSSDTFQRARTLARDFAEGVRLDHWSPVFEVTIKPDGAEEWRNTGYSTHRKNLNRYFETTPTTLVHASVLEILGYFERLSTIQHTSNLIVTYRLTPKSVSLLEQPEVPPSVFIGYGRRQSSALALLLEARLKEKNIVSFVDKNILGGEEWERLIEAKIKEVDHFICLLGKGTLLSENVRNEIQWAHEADNVWSIPFWQPDFKPEDELVDCGIVVKHFVEKQNAIRVTEESAEAYDTAVSQLLNQLGFAT
jgi:hypothetical protein